MHGLSSYCLFLLLYPFLASATILENGQTRLNPYPGQAPKITIDNQSWRDYSPDDAPEVAYKGRWDTNHVSCNIPGIKLGFTGNNLAINFGTQTSENVLVAYRIGGLDWEFSNVTANATYQFVGPWTSALNTTQKTDAKAFEIRVQIGGVFVDKDAQLARPAEFNKTVEIIGDSLSAGQYATYEGLASWAFNFAAGLGNVEYSITAYPGICLVDQKCYGGTARVMTHQWLQIPDAGTRANATYGNHPMPWDPTARRAADLVVINLGTNDRRDPNNIPGDEFYNAYVELVDQVHRVWPAAQIILMGLWGEFEATGNTYVQNPLYVSEIQRVYQHFESQGFVHYFDTKGILQHNDIAPRDHPTDVGHLKIASHLLQWVKIKLGWELGATGPEVQHDTLYWNNEEAYK
ncbi:acetylxylan esterase [Aspergillus floccosus]